MCTKVIHSTNLLTPKLFHRLVFNSHVTSVDNLNEMSAKSQSKSGQMVPLPWRHDVPTSTNSNM